MRKEQINEVEATLFIKIYIDSNVTWEKQIEKSMQLRQNLVKQI
jgi:hypothetical protein